MEIIGSGIDATEIARIADAIERYGDRFVHRVFTDEEIAYCRRRRDATSSFAARFAAKEAAMKALGTGHSRGVFWRGIEVYRRGGPPQLRFHDGAAARFASTCASSLCEFTPCTSRSSHSATAAFSIRPRARPTRSVR